MKKLNNFVFSKFGQKGIDILNEMNVEYPKPMTAEFLKNLDNRISIIIRDIKSSEVNVVSEPVRWRVALTLSSLFKTPEFQTI